MTGHRCDAKLVSANWVKKNAEMVLQERRAAVLRAIVEDYICTATPVGSKTIATKYGLAVSPATIRNDTAYLEQEGYIIHPHHSAGSVPTDKAYRYYVGLIGESIGLPPVEQYLVREILKETKEGLEQWLKTVAAILARFLRNMVVITMPKAIRCRLKYLDLVTLQDFVALLVVVLCETRIRRQVLTFERKMSQEELTSIGNKLTSIYTGMTSSEILSHKCELSLEERQVVECVAKIISTEDQLECGEAYFKGLCLLLSQPEFKRNPRIYRMLEALEGDDWLRRIFRQGLDEGKVKVVIGEENPEPALQDLSLVISQYGVVNKASGIIGVVGPKRMEYNKAISSLYCLSSLLSNSVAEFI